MNILFIIDLITLKLGMFHSRICLFSSAYCEVAATSEYGENFKFNFVFSNILMQFFHPDIETASWIN